MKIKMAAIWKIFPRSKNAGVFSVIHDQTKIAACRKLFVPNSSKYSTESATSAAEEFSLRYLDGKHEGKGGKIFRYKITTGYYEPPDWSRIYNILHR